MGIEMPIYEFKCDICGLVEERIVPHAEVDIQLCSCSAKATMTKEDKIYNTTFILNGAWYKTAKEY